VLLVGGSFLGDPWTNSFGFQYRGISANRRLAQNITTFLLPRASPRIVEVPPEQLIPRTERNLADFVLRVLAKVSPDWWFQCVPERVRREAADRHEQEKDRFPKHAYLDLIDLREIIRSNFLEFEPTSQESRSHLTNSRHRTQHPRRHLDRPTLGDYSRGIGRMRVYRVICAMSS
jgi:hypothetical protein